MAIVQADFGCSKESEWAILETINIARENHDHACLIFALSWAEGYLGTGIKIDITGSRSQGLEYLKNQIKELKNFQIVPNVNLLDASNAAFTVCLYLFNKIINEREVR